MSQIEGFSRSFRLFTVVRCEYDYRSACIGYYVRSILAMRSRLLPEENPIVRCDCAAVLMNFGWRHASMGSVVGDRRSCG